MKVESKVKFAFMHCPPIQLVRITIIIAARGNFDNITGGHLKSGEHFTGTFLPCGGTQEYGFGIIPNLTQNAMDLPNIRTII